MDKASKQLSNPFSSGGGGGLFEVHVQGSFVVLMLTGGYAPCLPSWPIIKIKLQGRFAGYETDDLVIFVKKVDSDQKCKILCQIKHSISISKNNKIFGEVIQAAWNDFNNPNIFERNRDVIALITGPLNSTDTTDVRTILDWARNSENATEFFKKVELTHFSSQIKRDKLEAFKTKLENANKGNTVSNEIIFEFLKHFYIFGFDFDLKTGVTLSLLHTLISQYSPENPHSVWTRLVDEVQSANKNSGTITLESLPEDIKTTFTKRNLESIPKNFSIAQLSANLSDWNQYPHISELVTANLLGSWNEKNSADLLIVNQMTNNPMYESWILAMQEIIQLPNNPLDIKNGKWRITEREKLWNVLGGRLFDTNLEKLKQCAIEILLERDPKFDLAPENRFAASVLGKALKHSPELRKGISESLALIGCYPEVLINCSPNISETITASSLQQILGGADWVLWGSLNDLLPILAEASPDKFLDVVEKSIEQNPCPFDELFSQEGDGITSGNYLTGLLWALEILAWDEKFIVRVCIILGELTIHDPGGNWANRPINSLISIFLPWFPQTIASFEKRKVAYQTLQKEIPEVAWRLLLNILPNEHQVTTGTLKPRWRNTIPVEWKMNVTRQDYWEQVIYFSEQIISIVNDDYEKLVEIIKKIDSFPQKSFNKLLDILSSNLVTSKPEEDRLPLWLKLMELISRHKQYSYTKWAMSKDKIYELEIVAEKIAPSNPLMYYSRIFNGRDHDLYENKSNWRLQSKKLEIQRQKAIKIILNVGGIDAILEFVKLVQSTYNVGYSLGIVAPKKSDKHLIPSFLNNQDVNFSQFIEGYIWSRYQKRGWKWVDSLDRTHWIDAQTCQFLCNLPFTKETWDRAGKWLNDREEIYWTKSNVNPYQSSGDIEEAINKLLVYKRPNAAIRCLSIMKFNKQPLDISLCVKTLLAAISSTESSLIIDTHEIIEIIKTVQESTETERNELFQVEWAYLPLLDRNSGASPRYLETRLAIDPIFFCELIRLLYRSKKEEVPKLEQSEKNKSIAINAFRLLNEWHIPPGLDDNGDFSSSLFLVWLEKTKEICIVTGHLEVALTHVGRVLYYSPPGVNGLWIDQAVADSLNAKDAEEMRNGFTMESFNSRGVHWIDPTGKPERELANQYRQKAVAVENFGYQRFAVALRNLADTFDREADRNIAEHRQELENDQNIE